MQSIAVDPDILERLRSDPVRVVLAVGRIQVAIVEGQGLLDLQTGKAVHGRGEIERLIKAPVQGEERKPATIIRHRREFQIGHVR